MRGLWYMLPFDQLFLSQNGNSKASCKRPRGAVVPFDGHVAEG
jgi:hypothetical protein